MKGNKKLEGAAWAFVAIAFLIGCNGSGDRSKQAVLVVLPNTATLEHSKSQKFTAIATGLSSTAVSWSVNGGSIDGSGETVTYTAPAKSGIYILTATSVADPKISSSAAIVSRSPCVNLFQIAPLTLQLCDANV